MFDCTPSTYPVSNISMCLYYIAFAFVILLLGANQVWVGFGEIKSM